MTIGHAFVSLKADGPDATEVRPSNWNAGHVIDSTGADFPIQTGMPAVPASGARVFGRSLAGRATLSVLGADGGLHTMQANLGRSRLALWLPSGNGTTITQLGGVGLTSGGAGTTARTVGTASLFDSLRRIGAVSNGGAAGASTSFRTAVVQWWRGNAAGLGGFLSICRFGNSDAAAVADARCFVGFRSTTAEFPNANPSAQVNIIGVGADSGDTNLSIMHNDGSGTATKISLGANFPANTTNTDVYELVLYAPPNASYVNYLVRRLNTMDIAEGQITTDLPPSTQLLAYHLWRNTGTSTTAVAIDMISVYLETET